MMKLTGYNPTWSLNKIDKTMLLSQIKTNQNDLPKQRMINSYAEALIPLRDCPVLRFITDICIHSLSHCDFFPKSVYEV